MTQTGPDDCCDNCVYECFVAPAGGGIVMFVNAFFYGVTHKKSYGKEESVPANLTPENREYRRVGRPSNGVDQHERKLNKMLDKVFAFAVEHVDDWNLDHRITTRLLAE